jgi:competence protein ComEA
LQSNFYSYFSFTKKERLGIISLCLFIAFTAFLPQLYFKVSKKILNPKGKEIALTFLPNDSSQASFAKYNFEDDENHYSKKIYEKENLEAQLFTFDPNTIDLNTWQKLGVRLKTAASIRKYIDKGGSFKTAEDINKIWGLSDAIKARLIPYVSITQIEKNYTNSYTNYVKPIFVKKVIQPIEINSADSATFESLPGIGGGFARRIINFRTKLGGFYKVAQVAETFGLPDSTYQKIFPYLNVLPNIKKLHLNRASTEELKSHPYIRWQIANVIANYKKQHGDFKTVSDLKLIMSIDAETYEKISPYLTVD